ncbi:hypothetical protein EG329_002422 [Mollisiaceae sp. DMI_Dod_QoI]|nr:hypothetical protein EG329_002422 [Helotiales sp. DMI_Dod_QoI]
MLARLLLHNQSTSTSSSPSTSSPPIKLTIFESEPTSTYRSQGGTLDLHPRTGLSAMKLAGLHTQFLHHARYESAVLRVCDKHLTTWFQPPSSKTAGNPEIDRAQLRQLLLESLPQEIVEWGMKLVKIDPKDHSMYFENGQVRNVGGEEFDLVVGADGAWSKVRQVLDPDTKPLYSGVTRYWSTIPNAEVDAPEVVQLINRGNLFSYGDGKGIIAQQMGEGIVDVSIGFTQPEIVGQEAEVTSTEEVLRRFEGGGWDERLLGIVRKAESKVLGKSLYMLPTGYRWQHMDGVTILGDAAHLITPFGGEGVNIAFDDAVRLSEAILKSVTAEGKEVLYKNVRAFEEDMWERGKGAAVMSCTMMEAMFMTPGAPRASVERWLLGKVKHELPGALYPLAVVIVYTGFFVYKLFN